MKRILPSVLAVGLIGTAVVLAGVVIQGQPTATSNGVTIDLHWESGDETGMTGWEISRAGYDGAYAVLVRSYPLKGNDQGYDFIDETAFRTTGTFYKYRVVGLFRDGSRSDPYETGVNHSPNAVRKTWGSIKAMFR